MANRDWLDEVRRRLVRKALPPEYVERFTEELVDHFHDLTEETMSTEANVFARLGSPEQLVEAATTSYRRRTFLGRHPVAKFLIFGVSPVVSLIILFFLTIALTCAGLNLLGRICDQFGLFGGHSGFPEELSPSALALMGYVFSLITIVLPSLFASLVFCKLGKRLGVGGRCMFVSCLVLAVIAMLPCWFVNCGPIKEFEGCYGVHANLWIPGYYGWIPPTTIPQLIQFLAPLTICAWFLRRGRSDVQIAA